MVSFQLIDKKMVSLQIIFCMLQVIGNMRLENPLTVNFQYLTNLVIPNFMEDLLMCQGSVATLQPETLDERT